MNPTLTKILFAGLLITFVTSILIINYSEFAIVNGANIEEPYRTIFYDIASYQANFTVLGEEVGDQGIVRNILNFGENLATGTVNVFITGLKAMGTFFEMIPLWGDIMSFISLGIPQISALISLLIVMLGIYIAMRYIQSVSNKDDLP